MTNSKSHIDRLIELRDNEEIEWNDWEETFIRSCVAQLEKKDNSNGLSIKQLNIVDKLEDIVLNGRPTR